MAADLRPTGGLLIVNYLVTLGILGAIVFLSVGQPTTYYYATPYNDHEGLGGDYGEAMSCQSCHGKPFTPVVNSGCATTECHSAYLAEFRVDFTPPIYEPGWLKLKQENPQALADRRAEQASLVYHKLPGVMEMQCVDCHVTHRPPPAGVPRRFPHDNPEVLPAGVLVSDCAACHDLKQAPPIGAHATMLQSGVAQCWSCHHSTSSWSENVTRPEGLSVSQAVEPIDGERVVFVSVPEPSPTATPIPTMSPDNPFADAPAVEPDGPPPTPTPVPLSEEELDWRKIWIEYDGTFDFAAADRPVLLLLTNKDLLSSNRFEVYFERAREAVRHAVQNMVLVRVNTAQFPGLAPQYRLPGPPGLVRLDETGAFHSRFFAGDGRVSEERILHFLTNETRDE